MKKYLSILLSVFLLMSSIISVSALTLNDANEAELLFPKDKISVEGNTITLTENIFAIAEGIENNGEYLDYNEPIIFESGTYVIDLNGCVLVPNVSNGPSFIIKNGANVTIKNSNDNYSSIQGLVKIEDGATFIAYNIYLDGDLESYGTVTLNEVNVSYFLTNCGTLTINGGFFGGGICLNAGKTYINGGYFNGITQNDGELYITNCETQSGLGGLVISCNADVTVLSGGRYKLFGTGEPDLPYIEGVWLDVLAPADTVFPEDYIKKFVPEGYRVVYDGFSATDVGYDNVTGYLNWCITYDMVQILPTPDKYSDVMKKITDSTVWTVKTNPPEDSGDSEFLLSAIARSLINDKNYDVWAVCNQEPFNPNRAMISIRDLTTNKIEEYYVDMEYKSPDVNIQKLVDKQLDKMKTDNDNWKFYDLDDLHLINYLTTIKDGNIESHEAINFAKEFIEDVGGGKFTFGMDTRLGGGPNMFLSYEGGHTIILYDGVVYATTEGGITYKRVIYVPSDTKNTADAYMAAALKRIKDYFGQDCDISIKVGGKLSDIDPEELEAEQEEIGFTKDIDNYFILTVNDVEYDFVISKSNKKENFTTPVYKGKDLIHNIEISTTDKSVPFDTMLSATSVKNDTIKQALGTENYVAYDISLYSSSLGSDIRKLENGKFYVGIPVPETLKDKTLTVYYIDDEGKPKEYNTEIDKNGVAYFETNHFSIYALTEKVTKGSDNNSNTSEPSALSKPTTSELPKSGDNRNISLLILLMFASFLGGIVCLKRIKVLKK